MAWPGKLTLTDKALYFEVLLLDDVNLLQLLLAIGIATCQHSFGLLLLLLQPVGSSKSNGLMRLNISRDCAEVKKTSVGLFKALQFDTAVSVSAGEKE